MKKLEELDKNFIIESTVKKDDIVYFDAESEPFRIYGVKREGECFRRMPEKIAESVSEGVHFLSTNTAGGRVRFVTDSPYVAIKTHSPNELKPHMPLTGTSGFDLYSTINGGTFYDGTFKKPFEAVDGYESVLDVTHRGRRIVTINFPLYTSVSKLYIGLKEGCILEKAPDYSIEKPIVYYGSSITQGGCASKPGSSYESILSRKFDCNYINLGFAGNAKAEDNMIKYLTELEMSVFVFDYDHNAPTTEHLHATHEKLFKEIRKVHPEIPVIIMPRPKYILSPEEEKRHMIVYTTYENAVKNGDKNVYFISGKELMALTEDNGTVDNCHPTDSGFLSMAKAIEKVLADIFEKILSKKHNTSEKMV